MLNLSRRTGQSLMLNDDIEIVVQDIHRNYVKIGIKAPDDVSILRKELYLEQQKGRMEDTILCREQG